jgi:outer membrane protein
MKKQFITSLLVSSIAVFGSQVALAADEAKFPVAVVDGTAVFQKFQPGIESELKKEFADQQQKLVKMQEELQTMSEKLDSDADIMKADEVEKMQETFAEKQMEFQQVSLEYNEAYNKRGNEVFQTLIDKVQKASEEIAKENGYELVVQRGAVLYADDKLDVTDALVKKIEAAK